MLTRFSFFFLSFVLFGAPGCHRSKSANVNAESTLQPTRIRGVIEGCAEDELVLEEMGARELIPVDTVVCDTSGSFEITFTPEDVAFYILRYGNSGYVTLLIEPGESLNFSGTKEQVDNYQVDGSPGSELLSVLAAEHKKTLNALGEITRKNMDLISLPGYPAMKINFDRQFDSITSHFREYSLQYIEENASSLAILIALYNLYGQGLPVFDPGTDFQVYKFVDSVLTIGYGEFEAVRLLHAQVTETEQLLRHNQPLAELQKGKIAPDFVSSRPDGTQLALSDLKGNYILLSFWAGWSQLSREENPLLRTALNRYGTQNFRILQVSLDDNREVWIGAIREDSLDWDQVSDLKRWVSPSVDLYGVDRIPYNVLIDPAGRVAETNLFGAELLNKLEIIFNQ